MTRMSRFQQSVIALLTALVLFVGIALINITPLRSQFASQGTFAGFGSGSGDAQTINLSNAFAYTDLVGVTISWVAAGSNDGPATLNVNGLGARNIWRPIPNGPAALGGGEIVATQLTVAEYDGSQFIILNSAVADIPGKVIDYAGASCPVGYLAATSAVASQTTYPALYAVLSTIWGSNGGGNFTTPDLRGRAPVGLDVSVGGFANRVTTGGGNYNNQTIASGGGQQNWTLITSQMPTTTPGGTITMNSYTPAGTVSGTVTNQGTGNISTIVALTPGSFTPNSIGSGWSTQTLGWTGSFSGTPATLTGSFSGTPFGSGQAHPVLSPGVTMNKCVRA